jgi:phosphopantetheinyl transferase
MSADDCRLVLALPECRVWQVALDLTDTQHAALTTSLSATERERARRLRQPVDRWRWEASRAWLRRLLAEQLDVSPRELEFLADANGKPWLAAPAAAVFFSVSHSEGIALVAVSRKDVGVDVEHHVVGLNVDLLAPVVLCAQERSVLSERARGARADLLLTCWVRKEALLKGLGVGLLVPPNELDVVTAPGRALASAPWDEALPLTSWTLSEVPATSGIVGALALETVRARAEARPGC